MIFFKGHLKKIQVFELIHLLNTVFHTKILSNTAETLQFENHASKKILFKKTCACSWEKSQIVSLSTFDQCQVFIIKYARIHGFRIKDSGRGLSIILLFQKIDSLLHKIFEKNHTFKGTPPCSFKRSGARVNMELN